MTTLDAKTRQAIRDAFQTGQLRVRAVDPVTGAVGLHVVSDVLKHSTAHKPMVRTTLVDGRSVETTVDHSLFLRTENGIQPVEASALKTGDRVATVEKGEVLGVGVASVETLPPEEHTYDLAVPGPENFLLTNGILAHNSYSIGGVSLDLDKSSRYESAYSTIKDGWETQLERAKATVKIIRGLQQPKYGIGIRSAFGPHVGSGVITPRKFIGF